MENFIKCAEVRTRQQDCILPDMSDLKKSKNVLLMLAFSDIYKSRIKKLAAERPEECEIVAENQDGSLCAHIPVAWIKINPAKQLSEEQRREIAERFKRK